MRRSYSTIYDSGGGGEEDLGQYGEYFWVENKGKYSANIYAIQSGYDSETITVEYSYYRDPGFEDNEDELVLRCVCVYVLLLQQPE